MYGRKSCIGTEKTRGNEENMKDWMTKRKIIALGAVIVCCFALIAGIGSMMQKEEAPAQSEPLEIQAKEEQTQTEIQTTPLRPLTGML